MKNWARDTKIFLPQCKAHFVVQKEAGNFKKRRIWLFLNYHHFMSSNVKLSWKGEIKWINKKPIPFQKSISNTSWFTKHLNSIDCWLEVSFYFGYRVIRWLIDKSRWLFSKVAESFSSNCCKLLEVAITASNIQSWDFQINAKLS